MAAVPTAVIALARPVQSAVDAITLAVEFCRANVVAVCSGDSGKVIVAGFDHVTAPIHPVLNAIAMIGSQYSCCRRQPCKQER